MGDGAIPEVDAVVVEQTVLARGLQMVGGGQGRRVAWLASASRLRSG
jgi:hypothetical protein